MPILYPRDRKKNKGKRSQTSRRRNRAAVVQVRLKNRPPSENICEICYTLKKGTTWSDPLYGWVCRDKQCRVVAGGREKKEKEKQKQQEREEKYQLEQEAREYESSCKEETDLSEDGSE